MFCCSFDVKRHWVAIVPPEVPRLFIIVEELTQFFDKLGRVHWNEAGVTETGEKAADEGVSSVDELHSSTERIAVELMELLNFFVVGVACADDVVVGVGVFAGFLGNPAGVHLSPEDCTFWRRLFAGAGV